MQQVNEHTHTNTQIWHSPCSDHVAELHQRKEVPPPDRTPERAEWRQGRTPVFLSPTFLQAEPQLKLTVWHRCGATELQNPHSCSDSLTTRIGLQYDSKRVDRQRHSSCREAHAAQCRCSTGANTHLEGQERVDRQRSKKGQNPQVRTKKLEGERKRKGNYLRRRKELQHRRETAYKSWSRKFEHRGLMERHRVSSGEENKIKIVDAKNRNFFFSSYLSFMKIFLHTSKHD